MQKQIKCPQCGSPAIAEIFQIVDVDKHPQLKRALMSNMINMAQCRNCRWSGQVATPFVYHESAHNLLISYVPMELNIPYAEQERMMGQLLRQVVESIPQQNRRAYLLQPQTIIRWQTLHELVLATEGITPAMIERQRRQMELLGRLVGEKSADYSALIRENSADIDTTFIMMVQRALQESLQTDQNDIIVALSNLQATLMTETDAGKRIEQQQLALRDLEADAKAANEMTPMLLLTHVLRHQDDDDTIDMLVKTTGALSYEFFGGLTSKIEELTMLGEVAKANRLTELRTRLLKLYQEWLKASEKAEMATRQLIQEIVDAPDKATAIMERGEQINELFFRVLENEIKEARQSKNLARSAALNEIKQLLDEMMQEQPGQPPEIELISALLDTQTSAEREALLSDNQEMLRPELLELLTMLEPQLQQAPPEIQKRFQEIKGQISRRLLTA